MGGAENPVVKNFGSGLPGGQLGLTKKLVEKGKDKVFGDDDEKKEREKVSRAATTGIGSSDMKSGAGVGLGLS